MKVTFKRALLAVLVLLFLVYGVDYLQLRYRIWRNKRPYGTVTVQLLYAISKKAPEGSDRTEYASGNAQDETCVNSLFPHFGYTPCWYLGRHTERRVNI
ncbi:MAG TPA: hypothetical protein VI636_25785 [Candidatus Angelobacter sp.]